MYGLVLDKTEWYFTYLFLPWPVVVMVVGAECKRRGGWWGSGACCTLMPGCGEECIKTMVGRELFYSYAISSWDPSSYKQTPAAAKVVETLSIRKS
jgi:hypothetical protein